MEVGDLERRVSHDGPSGRWGRGRFDEEVGDDDERGPEEGGPDDDERGPEEGGPDDDAEVVARDAVDEQVVGAELVEHLVARVAGTARGGERRVTIPGRTRCQSHSSGLSGS